MGETILITGGAKRLGAVMARDLAAMGHAVVVHYNRSIAEADALVAKIGAAGGRAAALGRDLSDRAVRGGLLEDASKAFGPVTVLINNASQFYGDTPANFTQETWDIHFGMHAEVPSVLAAQFAAQLPDGVAGNIVNMIDERVLRTSRGYFSYALSKSVMWDATRAMALHYAPHIRVNAIGPGPSLKEEGQSDEAFAGFQRRLPLGRGPELREFAATVRYFLETPSITGQMIALDGGRHLLGPETG